MEIVHAYTKEQLSATPAVTGTMLANINMAKTTWTAHWSPKVRPLEERDGLQRASGTWESVVHLFLPVCCVYPRSSRTPRWPTRPACAAP